VSGDDYDDDGWEPGAQISGGCPAASPVAAQQAEHAGFMGALTAHLSAYEAAEAAFAREVERCRVCRRGEVCRRHDDL
jgi:hypothetical protein